MNKPVLPFLAVTLLLISCSLLTPRAAPPTKTPEPMQPTVTPTLTATSTAEPSLPTQTATPEIIHGAIARVYLETILEEFEARPAGTDSEAKTAQYIKNAFLDLGYGTGVQTFSRIGWVGEDEIETTIKSANVIAFKAGDSEETFVVGAHYDSAGDGIGADDNASGVAVLLEVAELLKDTPTPYTIYFVAFGAEEVGLPGSQAYLEALSEKGLAHTVAMINLDSVIAGDIPYVYSAEGDKAALRDWTMDWANQNGFDLQTIPNVDFYDEEGYGTSDFAAFDQAGIPFVYFESTNWTLGSKDGYTQVSPKYGDRGTIFHTRYDRLDYLDETFPGRVDERLQLMTSLLEAILTQFKFPN